MRKKISKNKPLSKEEIKSIKGAMVSLADGSKRLVYVYPYTESNITQLNKVLNERKVEQTLNKEKLNVAFVKVAGGKIKAIPAATHLEPKERWAVMIEGNVTTKSEIFDRKDNAIKYANELILEGKGNTVLVTQK